MIFTPKKNLRQSAFLRPDLVRPDKQSPGTEGWLRIPLLAFAAVLLCFPEMPLRFRYLAPVALVAFFAVGKKLKQPVLFWLTIFTAHTLVAGVIVWWFNPGEDLWESFTAVRPYALAILAFGALRGLTLRWLVIFAAALLASHCLGVAYDVFVGPPWQRLPFPIFSETDLELIGKRLFLEARYGGFMFEAGAVGGLASLLAFSVFSVVYCLWNRGALTKDWALAGGAIVALSSALAIFLLARTKSALFIAAFYVTGFLVAGLFSQAGHAIRRQIATVLAVILLGVLAFSTYALARDTDFAAYIDDEIDNFKRLMTVGFGAGEGRGLASRMNYYDLAGRGLIYHPLGVGKTSGESFVKPVEDKIQQSSEMRFFFEQGIFRGYKAYLPNIAMQAGVVGLICFAFMLRGLAPRNAGPMQEMPEVIWGMRMAFFGASLAVELLPLFELMVISALLFEALQLHLVNTAQHKRRMGLSV